MINSMNISKLLFILFISSILTYGFSMIDKKILGKSAISEQMKYID